MGCGKRSAFSGRCLTGCPGNSAWRRRQRPALTSAVEAGAARAVSVRRFTGYLILAGSMTNAAIAAYLLFHLPASREPTMRSLIIRACSCSLAEPFLAGMAGSRFYWNRSSAALRADSPLSFRRFVLVNAEAWVWVPAIVLLSRRDSHRAPPCAVHPGRRALVKWAASGTSTIYRSSKSAVAHL